MATGDLSTEQRRFVDRLVGATGLHPTLAVAWVGCETGWGTTKASHNYLNVGPGHTYASVDQAADATASLIRNSGHYAGIRAAIVTGSARAQLDAIAASPWGSNPTCIGQVLGQLGGGATVTPVVDLPDWVPTPGDLPTPGDVAGGIGNLIEPFFERAMVVGLGLVLTTAALGVIALGLVRLTGVGPKEALNIAMTAKGAGQMGAGAAAAT